MRGTVISIFDVFRDYANENIGKEITLQEFITKITANTKLSLLAHYIDKSMVAGYLAQVDLLTYKVLKRYPRGYTSARLRRDASFIINNPGIEIPEPTQPYC